MTRGGIRARLRPSNLYTFTCLRPRSAEEGEHSFEGPGYTRLVHCNQPLLHKKKPFKYRSNYASTTKYNVLTFLPKALYETHDSKVMQNATKTPSKRSKIEPGDLIYQLYWFRSENKVSDATLVVLQATFINKDKQMYDEETGNPAQARTSNLNEELGQVDTILSDKTGTLTCNQMDFLKCSIAGTAYGVHSSEVELAAAQQMATDLEDQLVSGKRENNKKLSLKVLEFKLLNMLEFTSKTKRMTVIVRDEEGQILLLCKGLSMTKEALEDWRRFIQDIEVNNRKVKFHNGEGVFGNRSWKKLRVGDVVKVKKDQFFPADLLLLSSSYEDGICYVETLNLDGETNLKVKRALEVTLPLNEDVAFKNFTGTVKCEDPNPSLYTFISNFEYDDEAYALDPSQILLRDSKLRNTAFVYGIVIFTGHELQCINRSSSIIFDRPSKNGSLYEEDTTRHLNEYGEGGLRTLALAYKRLGESEYSAWNDEFQKARTSIGAGRDAMLENVTEMMERDLILVGATAVEDKLQKGVPQCIDRLAQAGMKIWVLTGDKVENAINIGYACSLLRQGMKQICITAISSDDREVVKENIMLQISNASQMNKHEKDPHAAFALIIDGKTLAYALEDDMKQHFLVLAVQCASVVCCCVSPMQKALVTRLVKEGTGKTTLAIGDGANDLGMIKEADIGVGISGVEGMQAVMASDFSIAQFRFLERLLVVHGHWCYKRIAQMVCYFFYKNIAFGLTLLYFEAFAGFFGQSVYDDWYMLLFNVVFTSLPVISPGVFEQDVSFEVRLQFLKKDGLKNAIANVNGIWIDGKKVSVVVANYQKQRLRQAVSSNVRKEEDKLKKGMTWRRRGGSESFNRLRDDISYKDALVSYDGRREVPASKETREGHPGKEASLRNLWKMHIPSDEYDWVKRSITEIIKSYFELELVVKGLANDGIKVNGSKWVYSWNSCILTFGSKEEFEEAWSNKREELFFWFDWLDPLMSMDGVLMAFCAVELVGVPLLYWNVPFLEKLVSRWGKLVCIHESTVRREDLAMARALLRVASLYDIQETATLGSYGKSFKVKINVGSVSTKQDSSSVANFTVAGDGESRDEASSEEKEDRFSGGVGSSKLLAEDSRDTVDIWLVGDDRTTVVEILGDQQHHGSVETNTQNVANVPSDLISISIPGGAIDRGTPKKSKDERLEEVTVQDNEDSRAEATKVVREARQVHMGSNQGLGLYKESLVNGIRSWSPLDHLSRSLHIRNASIGMWNRGSISRMYKRTRDRNVWFNSSREERALQSLEMTDHNRTIIEPMLSNQSLPVIVEGRSLGVEEEGGSRHISAVAKSVKDVTDCQSGPVARMEKRRKRRLLIRESLDVVSLHTASSSNFSVFLEEALATWEGFIGFFCCSNRVSLHWGDFNVYLDPVEKLGKPQNWLFIDILRNFLNQTNLIDLSMSMLPRSLSDHNPIALEEKFVDWGPKPFRFFNYLLEEEGFEDLVKSSLDNLQVSKRRRDLELKINDLEIKAQSGVISQHAWDQLIQFRSNLWRLSKRNEITSLKFNASVVSDPQSIKLHIADYFKEAYNSKLTLEVVDLSMDFAKLTGDQSSKLKEQFSKNEIWQAIASSDSSKAPSPDGFTMGC
ncbi:putative phospholipid-transporting ATPase 5 [Hibiscus syriacus]|uniref:Phospholipid-transporting ATPase n=1 Tax=Hibiscus syriacus TaxID=106335 RepID=A0A6A2XH34_HIBSY|nr:putative phospholipid-transporting ATPase 5 [Hibiscus syriacus]